MKRLILCILLSAIVCLAGRAQDAPADSLPPLTGNWLEQLRQANFNINDPRIRYPRFANFCRKVYNWGDRTFNSYDTAYVVGTGRNWKVTAEASAWAQAYGYLFDMVNGKGWNDRIIIRSNLNYDMGVHVSFMAVSIGYTWNINKLAGHNDAPRSTFNFAFNCARFSAEIQTQSTDGNTYIERFGRYEDGRRLRVPLNDVHTSQFTARAYYYFNNRRYSQASVYAFSKYQLRSQGSWMLGIGYDRQRTRINFAELPQEMLDALPEGVPIQSVFNFHDFKILGGYGYNFVMPHNWVLNLTALPAIGYRRSLLDGKRSFSQMLSATAYGRLGLTYNHRAFFANFSARTNIGLVFDANYSFLNLNHNLTLTLGARF